MLSKLIHYIIDEKFKGSKNTFNNMIMILKPILETIPIKQLPLRDFSGLTKFLLNS